MWFFGFERAPLAFLLVDNNISACRWQKLFGLERATLASLSVHNNISACRRQKIFDLFGFEWAPSASLSLHNTNISACCRQKCFGLFGFERVPSASLSQFTMIKVPAAGKKNFWLAPTDQIHSKQKFPIRFFKIFLGGCRSNFRGWGAFSLQGEGGPSGLQRGDPPLSPPYWFTVHGILFFCLIL